MFRENAVLTRIVSPSHRNYIFYQYDDHHGNRITRPLNSDLFIEASAGFQLAFERFIDFLATVKKYQGSAAEQPNNTQYIASGEINKVVYTMQQSIGSIGDFFANPNQARKRIGQLFSDWSSSLF